MVFPGLLALEDAALLFLRVWLALVFLSSGWSHVTDPQRRAKSIGMPVWFTFLLGAGEIAGAVSIALGVWTQLGAIVLIGTMLGAVWKKAFVWKTGFWGDANQGWWYEGLYIAALFVILTTGGGRFVLG